MVVCVLSLIERDHDSVVDLKISLSDGKSVVSSGDYDHGDRL